MCVCVSLSLFVCVWVLSCLWRCAVMCCVVCALSDDVMCDLWLVMMSERLVKLVAHCSNCFGSLSPACACVCVDVGVLKSLKASSVLKTSLYVVLLLCCLSRNWYEPYLRVTCTGYTILSSNHVDRWRHSRGRLVQTARYKLDQFMRQHDFEFFILRKGTFFLSCLFFQVCFWSFLD